MVCDPFDILSVRPAHVLAFNCVFMMSPMFMIYPPGRETSSCSQYLSTTITPIIAIPQSINPTITQHVILLLPVGFIASGLSDNHKLRDLPLLVAVSSSSSSPSKAARTNLLNFTNMSECVGCFLFFFFCLSSSSFCLGVLCFCSKLLGLKGCRVNLDDN